MAAVLCDYEGLSLFADELISELTPPSRERVRESLDQLDEIPAIGGLSDEVKKRLRELQTEWSESSAPEARFEELYGEVSDAEGEAILAFLEALQAAHGEAFLGGEVGQAIETHWGRYRAEE
jgi:hypothetical protein